MPTQDELKALVAKAALEFVPAGAIVGVGTGSTVNLFIDALATIKGRIQGALSSSVKSTDRMRGHGIPVIETDAVARIPVYIDGADEIDHRGNMIKGGGGALTREKIVADLAERFICIADESKLVQVLGKFPLPVEVIPMARAQIERRLRNLGGEVTVRANYVTDNGNLILDVRGLQIVEPLALEHEINQWPGIVEVGIFAMHRAKVCLLGTPGGVRRMDF